MILARPLYSVLTPHKHHHRTPQPQTPCPPGSKLRVVGSALSPNGMAFSEEGMLSLAHMDAILSIDAERRLVTVQAGARIADVAARLRERGLTLQNYASIREQSVAGFVQAGAHGTGAGIPPVDAQVVGMKLVTPAEGVLDLTEVGRAGKEEDESGVLEWEVLEQAVGCASNRSCRLGHAGWERFDEWN